MMRWSAQIVVAVFWALPVGATPVVGGMAARKPTQIHPQAAAAFAKGAQAVLGHAVDSPKNWGLAKASLGRGETAYLNLELRRAEKELRTAVDAWLSAPLRIEDTEPAQRAIVLLVQVQLAQRHRKAANAILKRALVALPGFPGGTEPPPDVGARITKIRQRLIKAKALSASLHINSKPTGADVRLNGVRVGKTPFDLPALAPGGVRLAVRWGKRQVVRRLTLKGEHSEMIYLGKPLAARTRLLAALRAGSKGSALRAVKQIQQAEGGAFVCAGLVNNGRVYVLRLNGTEGRIEGAHGQAVPAATQAWRTLGRFCAAKAPSNVPQDELNQAVWAATDSNFVGSADGGITVRTWAWTALAAGAASAGTGIWLGLKAQDNVDAFNRTGKASFEDQARQGAVMADVSYAVSAGLVGLGIWLFLK